MLVRAKLLGSGTTGDPYRGPFPRAKLIAAFFPGAKGPEPLPAGRLGLSNGTMLVASSGARSAPLSEGQALFDVHDDDLPPGMLNDASRKTIDVNGEAVLVSIGQEVATAWAAHLDSTFAEHAGRFRPEVA